MEAVAIDFPGRSATVTARGVDGEALVRAVNAVDKGRFQASLK